MMKRIVSSILVVIMLVSAALLASCSTNDSDAPAGMKTISTELVKYKLHVPSNWIEDISTGIVTARYSDSDASNISMMTLPIENIEITIDDFWAGHKAGFEATFSDIEMIEEGATLLLGGVPAKKYVYTATVLDMKYRFMQVACINGGNVYLFTYTSTDELYESHLEDIDMILEHFEFN